MYMDRMDLSKMLNDAKGMLNDSLTRTYHGYESICKGRILTGSCDLLLARVESLASSILAAFSSVVITSISLIITPLFLIPTASLNLASRISGISSYKAVQKFTRDSNDKIYRTFRVHYLGITTIFLFLSASIINTFLPGILKTQNIFIRSIQQLVKPLDPHQIIRRIVPEKENTVKAKKKFSLLTFADKCFLRDAENSLYKWSCQNSPIKT